MIPEPWPFALLVLAALRCWWLLAEDLILTRWRVRFCIRFGRLAEEFVACPFCLGAWVAVAWWASWYWASAHWTLVAAVPFALSFAVGVAGALVTRMGDG